METVTITLRLYGTLRRYAPPNSDSGDVRITLRRGSTLDDLYRRLGIPADEVKQAFVNGRRQPPEHVFTEADEVGIFPPLAGGQTRS